MDQDAKRAPLSRSSRRRGLLSYERGNSTKAQAAWILHKNKSTCLFQENSTCCSGSNKPPNQPTSRTKQSAFGVPVGFNRSTHVDSDIKEAVAFRISLQ